MKTVLLQSSLLSRSVALLGIASLATAAFLVMNPAHAQNGPDNTGMTDHAMRDHYDGRSDGKRMAYMLDRVGATPEQKQKIADIAKQQSGDMKGTHERRMKARSDLAAALSAPNIDKSAVERLRSERSSDFDTQSKKRTQMMLDIAAVLSPEQRLKMRELMEKRRGGNGWGHRRDDRGPAPGMDKPVR